MILAQIRVNPQAVRDEGPAIVDRLTRKMTALMFELTNRIKSESIPEFFPHGARNITATVRHVPTVMEGSSIVGSVMAGGALTTKITKKSGAVVDYARVQEFGAQGPWTIEPFPPKKALAFMVDGKLVIVRRVTHPGIAPHPFMRSELENMESKIVAELQAAVTNPAA